MKRRIRIAMAHMMAMVMVLSVLPVEWFGAFNVAKAEEPVKTVETPGTFDASDPEIRKLAATADTVTVTESGGYEEGVYAEWEPVVGADGYRAYVAKAGSSDYERVDNELIRQYGDYWRMDAVGLAAGDYSVKIEAGTVKETDGVKDLDTVVASAVTGTLKVVNYDRSGFAFSEKSQFGTGSGAYNEDGTLRKGAQVIYVTAATAKTCTAWIHSNGAGKPAVQVTGFQAILDAKQKSGTDIDILDFRIIGCVNKADLDKISSSAEGIQIKGKGTYSGMNITLEGIGEDATVKGFGFLIRNCGNVELRNFAIMDFMDDGVSLDTGNCNIWVHDLELFYGGPGGDADQAKGDGSVDIKGASTNITVSYNHFWDSGKCSLCGMSDSAEFLVTYHHNWFDHSDSRHPRIRVASVHIYNNYFDGNAKYGVGTTKGSSAFVEANYFRQCKYPMMSSKQGTDALGEGTFSGEPGGMIKAYNNVIVGAQSLMYANVAKGEQYGSDGKSYDAYLASARSEQVPETYVTVSGGTKYNNFDTDSAKYDLGVAESAIDDPNNIPDIVRSKAGRLNGGDFQFTFSSSEDANYGVIPELKSKVVGYTSSVKSVGGIAGVTTSGSQGGAEAVSAPYADKASGEVDKGTAITLKTSTPDGKIYYTTDGNKPTEKSNLYTAPIVISEDTVIKAVTIKDGESSTVATFIYTIPAGGEDTGAVKAPTADRASGTVAPGTKVTLTNNTDGAVVWYTLDGSSPTADGNASAQSFTDKTKEFVINETTTIRAAAKKDDVWSRITTLFYTVGASGGSSSGDYIHNFTTSGKTSSFYTINGNMNSSPAEVTYEGLTLTAALKMESSTSITFTTTDTGSLTLVHETTFTGKTKIDGTNHNAAAGIITVNDLAVGEHTIAKGDKANLYYIAFKPDHEVEESGVYAPVADILSGFVLEKGTTVELYCDTEGAEIYYTTDGSEPDASKGTRYTGPITIEANVTIKAVAVKGSAVSAVSEFVYTVVDAGEDAQYVEIPTASPAPGRVDKGAKITLTTATEGAQIYYTTDGSAPDNARNENVFLYYDGCIVIDRNTTVKAYAVKPGYISSAVASFEYSVAGEGVTTVNKYEFNPQVIAQDNHYTANTDISATGQYGTAKDGKGYFTLVNTSSKKSMFQTVDGNGNTFKVPAPESGRSSSGITEYEWRYKFGSKSGADNRRITFANTDNATVTICAYVAEDKLTESRTVTLDNDSRVLTAQPTEYVYENIAPGGHNITADVGDYFILYIVVEEESTDGDTPKTPYDAEIKAVPAADGQPLEKGTQVTLSWKDSADKLYYTLDDTDPRVEGAHRQEYTSGISITKDTTIRAVAQNSSGEYSKIAVFKYTVKGGSQPGSAESWTVELAQGSYVYTGSAIRPELTVYGYDGSILVEGVDYTVKYSNNVKASVKADANGEYKVINQKKQPAVTITGKGNLKGKDTINFEIRPMDIADASVAAGRIIIEEGKKVSAPVICFNGVKLTAKDWQYKNAADKTRKTFKDGETLDIVGQGNFEGERSIPVQVVARGTLKDHINKFKVNVDSAKAKTLVYNGENLRDAILECITIVPSKGSGDMTGKYTVTLPDEVIGAGSVKFQVVGLEEYSGCSVSKSVKILPRNIIGTSDAPAVDKVSVAGIETCAYTASGATLSGLTVTWQGEELTNGKDYKVSYSGNKKVGSAARYTISFKGNFRGSIKGTFTVAQAVLDENTDGVEVAVPDKVCKDNAVCKSAPYVTINNALVKASEYEVTYSVGDREGTYVAKPKVSFGSETSKTVYVKIRAKGKNYKTAQGSELIGEYTVWKKDAAKKDLSKAKVTFYTADKTKTARLEYTGEEVIPAETKVTFGKDQTNYADQCEIRYVNNQNKGRATVIVTPKDGSGLIGGKTAVFNIVPKNAGGLKTSVLTDLLMNLFR